MSKSVLSCCNKPIFNGSVWILKDIKNFTQRKLFIGQCRYCNNEVALLIEKRIDDDKIFSNTLKGLEAVKTIYRERKRKLTVLPNINSSEIYGWIYGKNIEIKNKKGQVTQIRQYSADFYGNKTLIKKIVTG